MEASQSAERAADHDTDKSVGGLLANWASNTGMHGLPNIRNSHSHSKKAVWTLLLLAGLTVMTWQIVEIVLKFYSYPYSVTRNSEIFDPMQFPAVTICNKNPIRLVQFSALTIITEEIEIESNTTVTEISNGTLPASTMTTPPTNASSGAPPTPSAKRRKKRSTNNANDAKSFGWLSDSQYSTGKTRNHSEIGTSEISDSMGVAYAFMDFYNIFSNNWKQSLGHSIDNFLVECSFGENYCKQDNFTRYLHPVYGNCFTLNANRNSTSRIVQSEGGPMHGLTLLLYVEQDQYLGSVSNTAGAVLALHEPDEQPFPEESALSLSPGTETFIGVKRNVISRLASPYAEDCEANFQEANRRRNMFSNWTMYSLPNVNYSQNACIKTCLQKEIENKCKCSSPNLPISDPSVDPMLSSDYAYCLYNYNSLTRSISAEALCMQRVRSDSFPFCRQECKRSCYEVRYDASMSFARWPSESFKKDAEVQVQMYNPDIRAAFSRQNDTATFMQKNFIKVRVFYKDTVQETQVSSASYDGINAVSDVGGQVGLWLGLSVLTIFEIVEMLVDLGVLISTRSCKKMKGATSSDDSWANSSNNDNDWTMHSFKQQVKDKSSSAAVDIDDCESFGDGSRLK